MNTTKVTMIAAMDQNRLIGYQNTLPWHIPSEMKHFLQTVHGKPIIVTKRTYQDLPNSFKQNHRCYLITRNPKENEFSSLEECLDFLKIFPEVIIAGGSYLYQEGLNFATDVILTEIKKKYQIEKDGTERYFPKLPSTFLDTSSKTMYDQKEDVDFTITHYKKK